MLDWITAEKADLRKGNARVRGHWVHHPVQIASSTSGCTGPSTDDFWIYSSLQNPKIHWATCDNAVTFTVIPDVHRASPVYELVPFASGAVTGYDWKDPGSVFFVPSLQVLTYMDLPELFLLQVEALPARPHMEDAPILSSS